MVPGTEKTSLCLDLASSSDEGSLLFHSLETQSVQCLSDHRVCKNLFELRKKVRGKDQSSLLNNRFYARLPNVVPRDQAQRERSSFGILLCNAVKGWVQTLTTLCCTIIYAHSEHRFPAPSSKLCQIWLRLWRGTLYLRAAVHRRGQRPPKGLGTNDCESSLGPKHPRKHETHLPRVKKRKKSSVSIETIVVLFVLV